MKRIVQFLLIGILLVPDTANSNESDDYLAYHARVAQAEDLIAAKSFAKALRIYENIFANYDFVFLRDYRVATQLAWHLGEEEKTFSFLKRGIASGWTMKSIKKNDFLKDIRKSKQWDLIRDQQDSLLSIYNQRINSKLRLEIHEMFRKDQWKALGALFKLSSKTQDRYAEKKFAPQSELHLQRLAAVIEGYGYPGERLIGDDIWTQTLLGHHNSISQDYCKKDTMYQNLKPKLIQAVKRGQMSPFEYALIEDWFITVESGWQTPSYGFLAELKESDLNKANQMRSFIGLRKVETRNRLIDIQEETGMDFYLPWRPKKNGKIEAGK